MISMPPRITANIFDQLESRNIAMPMKIKTTIKKRLKKISV
jgi:hypothetical protein